MKIPLDSIFHLAIDGSRIADEIVRILNRSVRQLPAAVDRRLRVQLGFNNGGVNTRSLYLYAVYRLSRQFKAAASAVREEGTLSFDVVSELSSTLGMVNNGFEHLVAPNVPESSTLETEWSWLFRETRRMAAWAMLDSQAVTENWQPIGRDRALLCETTPEDQHVIGMLLLLEASLIAISGMFDNASGPSNENRKEVEATLKVFTAVSPENEVSAQRIRSYLLMFGGLRKALNIYIRDTIPIVQEIIDALNLGARFDRFGRELTPRTSSTRSASPSALPARVHIIAALLLHIPEVESSEQFQLLALLAQSTYREVTA